MQETRIKEINYTDIFLIPKATSPQTVNQFRHIAMCNSIYKLFSKIIINRLKPTMDTLITPNQANLIPKRNIRENIVVAQDILHNMNHLKGQKGYFSLKLDLAKAYDNLSWSFVEKIMGEASIMEVVKRHVMNVILSNKMMVQWKGEK